MQAFIRELDSKGYQGLFVLHQLSGTDRSNTGRLSDCLQRYLLTFESAPEANAQFNLQTYGYYKSPKDNINCRFEVEYSPQGGFKAQRLFVRDQASGTYLEFRVGHRHPIPAARSLVSRFPRKKIDWQGNRGFHP